MKIVDGSHVIPHAVQPRKLMPFYKTVISLEPNSRENKLKETDNFKLSTTEERLLLLMLFNKSLRTNRDNRSRDLRDFTTNKAKTMSKEEEMRPDSKIPRPCHSNGPTTCPFSMPTEPMS